MVESECVFCEYQIWQMVIKLVQPVAEILCGVDGVLVILVAMSFWFFIRTREEFTFRFYNYYVLGVSRSYIDRHIH